MNPISLTWLTIGACVVFLVAQDANIYDWLVLQSRNVRLWFERQWFMVRYNPDSPCVRWEINRNAERIAKELLKDQENNDF